MIDTLILHFFIDIPSIKKSPNWLYCSGTKHRKQIFSYYTHSIRFLQSKINFKYFPKCRNSTSPLLVVEFSSIPKLLIGNNHEMILDMSLILQAATAFIQSVDCLENIDAADGLLERVDFCINFQVGDKVENYLHALSKLTCNSRKVSWFVNPRKLPYALDNKVEGSTCNGVLAACISKSTSWYDKYKECLNNDAKGILRMETRVKGNRIIGETIGVKKPILRDITLEISKKVLSDELDFLGVSGDFLSEQNTLEELIQRFGGKEGIHLCGPLQALNLYPGKSVDELSEIFKVAKGTIYSWKAALKRKGISLEISPSHVVLPRLPVDFSAEFSKNHKKFLSDTGEAVTPFTEKELEELNAKLKPITDASPIESIETSNLCSENSIQAAIVKSSDSQFRIIENEDTVSGWLDGQIGVSTWSPIVRGIDWPPIEPQVDEAIKNWRFSSIESSLKTSANFQEFLPSRPHPSGSSLNIEWFTSCQISDMEMRNHLFEPLLCKPSSNGFLGPPIVGRICEHFMVQPVIYRSNNPIKFEERR